jgi:hypothetical protein
MMISEWWIVDGVEGRYNDLIWGSVPVCTWRAEEYHAEPVMLGGLWVGIWTLNPENTKPGCQQWQQTSI